jgi:hypothetical protein
MSDINAQIDAAVVTSASRLTDVAQSAWYSNLALSLLEEKEAEHPLNCACSECRGLGNPPNLEIPQKEAGDE